MEGLRSCQPGAWPTAAPRVCGEALPLHPTQAPPHALAPMAAAIGPTHRALAWPGLPVTHRHARTHAHARARPHRHAHAMLSPLCACRPEGECTAPDCAWCTSAAVGAACYTPEQAKRLPSAVFKCTPAA